MKCWGNNGAVELGLGDTANRGDKPGEMGDNLPAVDLGAGRTATAISAGDVHTCAPLDNGTLKCWGGNADGQLGLGDTNTGATAPARWATTCRPSNLTKGIPTLATQATTSVVLGSPISDTATLSGGLSPTGTVSFTLYGPNDANSRTTRRFLPPPTGP